MGILSNDRQLRAVGKTTIRHPRNAMTPAPALAFHVLLSQGTVSPTITFIESLLLSHDLE